MKPSTLFPLYLPSWDQDLSSHKANDLCVASWAQYQQQNLSPPVCHLYDHNLPGISVDPPPSYNPSLDAAWSTSTPCHQTDGGDSLCVFSSSTFAANRGISIITTPETASGISRLPCFDDPTTMETINQDCSPHFRVQQIPGKGLGMVANKSLKRGDRILSNTASTMVDYKAFEHVPGDEITIMEVAMVEALPEEHKRRYLALSTHFEKDLTVGERIAKVMETNAFDVTVNIEGKPFFYTIFPEISRLNHDCRPNADYYFDPKTLSQHVHATRPIAEGEEITITYLDPLMSRTARLRKLSSTWGFQCTCPLCTKPTPIGLASDVRIKDIQGLLRRLYFLTYYGNPSDPHKMPNKDLESHDGPEMAELLLSLLEQEGLEVIMAEAHGYAALAYNGVGESWKAKQHASMAVEMGLLSAGPEGEEVVEMERLFQGPKEHWSWRVYMEEDGR